MHVKIKLNYSMGEEMRKLKPKLLDCHQNASVRANFMFTVLSTLSSDAHYEQSNILVTWFHF